MTQSDHRPGDGSADVRVEHDRSSATDLDVVGAAGPHWLHPTSLLFEFFSGIRKQLIPAILAVYSAAQWGGIGLVLAIFFFAITMSFAVFRFLTVRYQVRDDELILDEGFFFRRHRTIPIHRIQNIDLMQTPFHRLFRVAEVRIETASGKEPEAKLRVLSLHRVDELRARAFRLGRAPNLHPAPVAAPIDATSTPQQMVVADPTVQRLLTIPTRLLVKAGFLSNRGMVLVAVLVGALFQFGPWNNDWMFDPRKVAKFLPWDQIIGHWVLAVFAVLVLLVLLRLLSVAWFILKFHGYVLELRGEEIQIRCGLFSRLSATIPRRRIQKICIQRTILGKWLGIAAVRVETAGGSSSESDGNVMTISRRWFIPAMAEADVPRIVSHLHTGVRWNENEIAWLPPSPRAAARLRRLAIVGTIMVTGTATWYWSWVGVAGGAALAVLAWWYAGKKASAMRYARGEFGIAYRSGMLTKKCSVTFTDKVQSVWVDHSPFDRRWGMATLGIDTAGSGPAEHPFHVKLLDSGFARREHEFIAREASKHRAAFR